MFWRSRDTPGGDKWWSDNTTLLCAHLLWKGGDMPLGLARGHIHAVVSSPWGSESLLGSAMDLRSLLCGKR